MNKAFFLMVVGGTHQYSGVVVPALDPTNFDASMTAAARIFYQADANCFTEGSDFLSARECTLMFALPNQTESVSKAWDAVGILPPVFLPLSNDVTITNVAVNMKDQLYFLMNETAKAGSSVQCFLSDETGDPDLYVRFGSRAFGDERNDCASFNNGPTLESCRTSPALRDTAVYVTVVAFTECTNMTLKCSITSCKNANQPCTSGWQCCGAGRSKLICEGATKNAKTCKRCKSAKKKCKRQTECCSGLKCIDKKCTKKT
jgi:bacillolysin